MFDISWTEFLLIGVIALIVIGPKELPGVLRTLGQYTRKVRSMAADFQNQFQEAMREAEMADLKKQVDDMAQDFKDFDPLKSVRQDVEAAGRDIEHSLKSDPGEKPALPSTAAATTTDAQATAAATASDVAAEPAAQAVAPVTPEVPAAAPVTPVERGELESVGAAAAVPPPEPAVQEDAPASTGHAG
jgi:sec-independent protein translocase protein TatB